MNRGWRVVPAILIFLILLWALAVGTMQEERKRNGGESFESYPTVTYVTYPTTTRY